MLNLKEPYFKGALFNAQIHYFQEYTLWIFFFFGAYKCISCTLLKTKQKLKSSVTLAHIIQEDIDSFCYDQLLTFRVCIQCIMRLFS